MRRRKTFSFQIGRRNISDDYPHPFGLSDFSNRQSKKKEGYDAAKAIPEILLVNSLTPTESRDIADSLISHFM